jgi:hypothetical protein
MLGNLQTIKAGFVGGLREGQALVEELRHRPPRILDVIEKSNFHDDSLLVLMSRPRWPGRDGSIKPARAAMHDRKPFGKS